MKKKAKAAAPALPTSAVSLPMLRFVPEAVGTTLEIAGGGLLYIPGVDLAPVAGPDEPAIVIQPGRPARVTLTFFVKVEDGLVTFTGQATDIEVL